MGHTVAGPQFIVFAMNIIGLFRELRAYLWFRLLAPLICGSGSRFKIGTHGPHRPVSRRIHIGPLLW